MLHYRVGKSRVKQRRRIRRASRRAVRVPPTCAQELHRVLAELRGPGEVRRALEALLTKREYTKIVYRWFLVRVVDHQRPRMGTGLYRVVHDLTGANHPMIRKALDNLDDLESGFRLLRGRLRSLPRTDSFLKQMSASSAAG